MHFDRDVAVRPSDPAGLGILVGVQQGRAGQIGQPGIVVGRQHLVVDVDQRAGGLGDADALGDDCGDPLPAEPQHGVQHPGVVRILLPAVVAAGREQPIGGVPMREHPDHPGQCLGPRGVDAADPGMRVRTAENRQMQQRFGCGVEGVLLAAGDDPAARGGRDRATVGALVVSGIDGADAGQRVRDRPVPGAAAEISLQQARQIGGLGLGQSARSDHEAGRAVTALEGARIEEGLLHGVQALAVGQPRRGGHAAPFGTVGGGDARVHGLAVQQHAARTAVARVAALLDLEMAELAQQGAQHLTGLRLDRGRSAVDAQVHGSVVNSATISIAISALMCRRQAASPCGSVNQESIAARSSARTSRLGGVE